MEAKPAVLMLTVWKKLTSSLSPKERLPIVPGLLYSVQRLVTVPKTRRPAVSSKTTLVWKCSPICFPPNLVAKSNQTIKPSPLVMMRRAKVILTKTSVCKPSRLSLPKLSNPALQNAETAKKIELKIPFPKPNLGMKRIMRRKAPSPSIVKVVIKIERTN